MARWILPKKRLAIYERDRWTCQWCLSKVARNENYDNSMATLDHVVGRRESGNNGASNLVTACWRCNNARGQMSALEFALKIEDTETNDVSSILDRVVK